jgi:2-keto-3-deoxy-galactonokinase
MVIAAAPAARRVALDWGGTRLAAWLLGDGGAILAERQNGEGASVLSGGRRRSTGRLRRTACPASSTTWATRPT